MEIEYEFLDSDGEFSSSPTLPQNGEVSNEEPQNSNEIFLTPQDDLSSPTFQDAIGTQSVTQEPQALDTGTKQESDTNPTIELNTLNTTEESFDYSTVPIATPDTHMSTIEYATSYNADTTGTADTADTFIPTLDLTQEDNTVDLTQEDNTVDCASNSIDNNSLLDFPTNSPLSNGNSPISIPSTPNPTNENSIQDNGDIPTVDFSCQPQTLVNSYTPSSLDILIDTESNNQTQEDQVEYSSNFPNSIPQSQTFEISFEDIPESPTNPEEAAQSQTLENAIDSIEHSSPPPLYSQTDAQTLENNLSRYLGYQQLIEERNSNSHHYSTSNSRSHSLSSNISNKGDLTVNSRQFSNANSNSKFPSFSEDSYLPRGCYTSKFKYFIPKKTNNNIQVGARPPVRMEKKRPQESTIFPCEETAVQMNETPQSPAESGDSSASENPTIDIDESILSTLEDRLQSLAAAPVEEDPICISSDEPDNEPDLYTQIELLDNKNFDLNIAIADLDNPQPYDVDLPISDPTVHTLSDCEPAPKVKKPRKAPEKITKRYKSKVDPAFVPESAESTDVSYGELSDCSPKPNKIQKIKDKADVETEKTDHIEKERRIGRPRKYEKVIVPPLVRNRKGRYFKKKRHAAAHYARLKQQAILEGRYYPNLHEKKKSKHKLIKETKCPSESDDSYQPEIRECHKSASDCISKPTMQFWSTGELPYDTTMQMVSTKHKYFALEEHFKSPYLQKIKLPDPDPEHSIEMKIVENGKSGTSSYSPAQGLRMMNADILADVFGKLNCPLSSCRGGKLKLYESTFKHGMQNSFVLFCSYCGNIVTKFCSSRQLDQPVNLNIGLGIKLMDRAEVNVRAMLGVHTTSLTWRGFRKFANIMDLPTPTTVMRRSEQMKFAEIVLAEVDESMRKWSKHIADSEGAVKSVRPGCVEVAVSFDGSWKQRGHYSNVGFAAVIERESKKVVDYELLNRNCEACSRWSTHMMEKKQEEYEAWFQTHKPHCKANFSGTSLAMESEAAVRMWRRSEGRGLVYNVFIGDGDGSGYKSVLRSGVYNGEVKIEKEECIGHLQKRLKNHLMKATKSTKNFTYVKHSLEEHKADRVAHLFAVVVGQHVGKPPEEMSSALWRMLGHISENHDDCPTGPNSYCLFQKQLYRHQNEPSAPAPKTRRCYFTDIDLDKIREEFNTYACVEVCSHLTLGATQNINESLHSCIWSSCLKTKYASPTCVSISVALSVLCFNEGQSALVGVLLALGIKPSINSIKEFVSYDKVRMYNREWGKSDQKKANRRQRKIDSKNREMHRRRHDKAASRILYQSDKHGVETECSARKSKVRNKPNPDKEDRIENNVEMNDQDLNIDTDGNLMQDETENDIIDAMEVEIHDTAEFQSHKDTPTNQEKKTTPIKPKKTTEPKPKKITKPKEKKVTEPKPKKITQPTQEKITEHKQKEITESKSKKVTEPKPKKITEPKPKKITQPTQEKITEHKQKEITEPKQKKITGVESKKSKSDTKEQNATKAGTKRKKTKIADKYTESDTEDDYTEEILKKPKLRKQQTIPSCSEESNASSSSSEGDESDGVCEDCDMRVPMGLLKGQWKWIGCEKCEKWFHDSCLHIQLDDFEDEDFICKACS